MSRWGRSRDPQGGGEGGTPGRCPQAGADVFPQGQFLPRPREGTPSTHHQAFIPTLNPPPQPTRLIHPLWASASSSGKWRRSHVPLDGSQCWGNREQFVKSKPSSRVWDTPPGALGSSFRHHPVPTASAAPGRVDRGGSAPSGGRSGCSFSHRCVVSAPGAADPRPWP